MKRELILGLALAGLSLSNIAASAAINVIATDPTLADLTRRVGGDRVKVDSLSRGSDDPHATEPRPSMIVKVARAKLFVRVGMDLDIWVDDVLLRSGKQDLQRGNRGHVDCSVGVRKLDIPTGRLDPSMGDIHVYGNPHYLLDPANAITAAGNIAAGLIDVDPGGKAQYESRYQEFARELNQKLNGWRAQLAPYRGAQIATYHKTWIYFFTRFGLKEAGFVEPKPGIAPSGGHVSNLIQSMKRNSVKVVLAENFRSKRFPDLISRKTGAKAVYVPAMVQGEPGIDSYFELFDAIVGRLAAALR